MTTREDTTGMDLPGVLALAAMLGTPIALEEWAGCSKAWAWTAGMVLGLLVWFVAAIVLITIWHGVPLLWLAFRMALLRLLSREGGS